jgi:hypothetical protein
MESVVESCRYGYTRRSRLKWLARQGRGSGMAIDLRIAALCMAFCAFFVMPARAQETVSDLFTVAGVQVDETAPDARQARTSAFARAQQIAFERLAARLTVGGSQSVPQLQGPSLDRLVTGLDLEEERRSGTRYIASVAVRFDPAATRSVLQSAGLVLSEGRAAPLLVIPVPAALDVAVGPDQAWRAAWEKGGYEHELAPIVLSPPVPAEPADWASIEPIAYATGASSALIATVRQNGTALNADLVEVGPAAARINRGTVSTQLIGGQAGLADAYRRLSDAANARIQTEWKAQAAQFAGAAKGRLTTSALYANQADWTRIKQGLEELSRSAISEIRIEAIAKEGALVSFAYGGSLDRVAEEFRKRGLILQETSQGIVIQVAA